MKKLLLSFLWLACSCQTSDNGSIEDPTLNPSAGGAIPADKSVRFLWRENTYDAEFDDSVSVMVLNEEYHKNVTDPERAALGYVATFFGNECWWDGEAMPNRENLKCVILTALNLGYQCSDQHLGFLRTWFKRDEASLNMLSSCPTVPYTSTFQETFDEINLTVKGNFIIVFFKARGMNMRESTNWSWHETNYFEFDKESIRLVKQESQYLP